MKLDAGKVRRLSVARGWSLARLLRESGVSPNAFYTLARKPSVLPQSLHLLASSLEVPVERILSGSKDPKSRARELLRELEEVLRQRPRTSRENAWHTLLLLDQPPIVRLRRGLLRAQTGDFHR